MRSGKVWTVFWCLLLLVIMAPLRVFAAEQETTEKVAGEGEVVLTFSSNIFEGWAEPPAPQRLVAGEKAARPADMWRTTRKTSRRPSARPISSRWFRNMPRRRRRKAS